MAADSLGIQGVLQAHRADPHGPHRKILADMMEDNGRMREMELARSQRPFWEYAGATGPEIHEWGIETPIDVLATILEEELPHGSGIDGDWTISPAGTNVEASNYYHAMNGAGFYCGYLHFTVTIPVADPSAFTVEWDADDVAAMEEENEEARQEIVEEMRQEHAAALNDDLEEGEEPTDAADWEPEYIDAEYGVYVEGIQEMVEEQIAYALEQLTG